MDPDKAGEIAWQYRAGQGGVLGGIEWGSAVDGDRAYFAVSDMLTTQPGGLHAVALATGERVWAASPPPVRCAAGGGGHAAQAAAGAAIAGAVVARSDGGGVGAGLAAGRPGV